MNFLSSQLQIRALVYKDRLKYSKNYSSLEAFFAVTDDMGYNQTETLYEFGIGRKDWRGQDIFIGDIVGHRYKDGNGIVKWDDCLIYVDNVSWAGTFNEKLNWDVLEVLGNIHENPELQYE